VTRISFTVNMLVMVVTWSVIVWLIWILLQVNAYGETYPVATDNGSRASAVCVGASEDRSLFLTNRHVIRGADELYVSDGTRWIKAKKLRPSKTVDLVSFVCDGTQFRPTHIMTGLPTGSDVDVCGYSKRKRFCFSGRYNPGHIDAEGRHVWPGDSGGAVLTKHAERTWCVGIANSYGTDRQTYFVSARDCALHLTQNYSRPPLNCRYGNCPTPQQQQRPNYERSYRVTPRFLAPPRVEYYEQHTAPISIQPPAEPPPDQLDRSPLPPPPDDLNISSAKIQRAVDNWMAKNQDKITGPPGKDGASVNISELAAYLAANYTADLKGAPGSPGLAGNDGKPGRDGKDGNDGATGLVGERGLQGQSGSTGPAGLAGPVGSPGRDGERGRDGGGVAAAHDRVIIMRENGREIDRETYAIDEPFVFNVETFVRQ
jgi:hypothetical protein